MNLTFLGTAASEGYPDAFCGCANCERARDLGGASSPDWDWALVYYRRAVAKYPEPVFPSVAALMEAEEKDPHGVYDQTVR